MPRLSFPFFLVIIVCSTLFPFSDNINPKDYQDSDSKYGRFLFDLGVGASKFFDDYASIGFGSQSSALIRIYSGNALGLSVDFASWKYKYPSIYSSMGASTLDSKSQVGIMGAYRHLSNRDAYTLAFQLGVGTVIVNEEWDMWLTGRETEHHSDFGIQAQLGGIYDYFEIMYGARMIMEQGGSHILMLITIGFAIGYK